MNGHYIRTTDDETLTDLLIATLPYLPENAVFPQNFDAGMRQKLLAAMPGLKERAKTLTELRDGAAFLFAQRPLALDAAAAGILDASARAHLRGLLPELATLESWNSTTTENVVRHYAEENHLKLGQVAQPLRAALTGRATSPGIFDVFSVLGRDESLARLTDQSL
jgi:glutamyl-tRNA synthetase